MTVAHGLGERIGDPRADADHGGLLDPEFLRDHIRGAEPDASDVARQPIRVFAHHLHGIGAVGLEDAHRPRRADAMLMQEDHDLADDLLIRPGRRDLGGPHRTDALDLPQPLGVGLDDVEHVLAELPDHALGVDRADAADHPGAKVLLDALDRRGGRGLQEPRPELLAMGAVVGPFARGRHPLAGRDHRRMAHRRDQIAMASGLQPQDAEAVLRVVEGDPLDETRENFGFGVCLLTHAPSAKWSLCRLPAPRLDKTDAGAYLPLALTAHECQDVKLP